MRGHQRDQREPLRHEDGRGNCRMSRVCRIHPSPFLCCHRHRATGGSWKWCILLRSQPRRGRSQDKSWRRRVGCLKKGERENMKMTGCTYVGNSRLANGMPKISALGLLVLASHPRASFHGERTLSILTLPDSVSRRPTLSQSCPN